MQSKRTKYIPILLILFAFLPIKGNAQNDTLSMTVPELFERINKQDLRLIADKIKEQIATEKIKSAKTKQLPQIILGINDGYIGQPIVWQNGLTNPIYPNAPKWRQNYSIDIKQPIYEGGKIRYSIKQNSIEKDIAILQRKGDEQEIKISLLRQYLNLFTLYKQQIVLDRNIKESEQRLNDIRKLREEGIITDNDVLRSELQLTNSKLSKTSTQNNINIISQQLDILLGLDETTQLVPDSSFLNNIISIDNYNDYITTAYQNNNNIKILDKKKELAETNIKLAYAEQLPKIYLTASNTLSKPLSRTLADKYNNNWTIGIGLSYPISSLYQNKNAVKVAKENLLLAQNAKERQQQNIRMQIKSSMLKYNEAKERVEALKLSLKQAEENYRIMNNRYMNQLAILTDLLDAENIKLNAEMQLISARTDVIFTYYQLQQTIGNL